MSFQIKIHYDNHPGFQEPYIWIWYEGSAKPDDFPPTGQDIFGSVYDISVRRPEFGLKFKDGPGPAGPWEDRRLDRNYRSLERCESNLVPNEIWCKGDKAFVYPVESKAPEPISAEISLRQLSFKRGI